MRRVKKVKYGKLFAKLAPVSSIIRVITAWLVFPFPLLGVITAIVLDAIDAPLYRQRGLTRRQYQPIDKTLDFYWYCVLLLYAYFSLPFFPFLTFLFILRLLGQLFFYATRDEKYFILFPNFFEQVAVFLVVIDQFPVLSYLASPDYQYISLGILLLSKIIQELIAHKYDKLYYPWAPEWVKAPE